MSEPPSKCLYLPAGQLLQLFILDEPNLSLYKPGGQYLQSSELFDPVFELYFLLVNIHLIQEYL